ncbi:hypothetical protein LSUE1_G009328 [Lachnellula suecica]|uniref:Uncharacterized protein n=1 Tax=Lachnellula suecica TaxID=602035 RepID=A0A8T9BTP0_9HELO|nr:hypothetical protein LSUE1_G009328 [Lachnellula suecica]
MFNDSICTNAPDSTATDAGVAGSGVLLSFIITAFLSLLISSIVILHEATRKSEAKILRKLLLSFSDQQVVTGIGIQSIALAKMNTMVPYHFFLVWMLSLLSTTTHVGTLLALVADFKRDWVLRWLRQFFMFANLCLSLVSGIFVLLSVLKNMPPTVPIACVWSLPLSSTGPPSNAGISIAGTIAVMVGQVLFFLVGVWYLHLKQRRWVKLVQMAGLGISVAIGAGAAVRVIMLSQAFGKPSVQLNDSGEKDWSFGQLLPLLLLLLPLVSSIEIFRGEMRIPSPTFDDQIPLVERNDKQGVRTSFQPNPFWGSQVSRFSR